MHVGISVPEADAQHGLAVRPDVLMIGISARVDELSATQAIAVLKIAAAKLQSKAVELHRGAELLPRKLDLGRTSTEKASKAILADAQIDGVLCLPLEDAWDYWQRAEFVAKVTEFLRSFGADVYRAKPSIQFGFRAPVPRVRDVSKLKAELTARYAAQWRALTGNGEKVPGQGSWEIPDEVSQYAVSLEEVRVALVPTRKFASLREG